MSGPGYRGPRDEVGRLAGTFDAMLARLQSGFEQRQAFYSLASHELRTPLTIVRGHLESPATNGEAGDVEVTSREGAGTTFTIRLPLAPASGARTDLVADADRRRPS